MVGRQRIGPWPGFGFWQVNFATVGSGFPNLFIDVIRLRFIREHFLYNDNPMVRNFLPFLARKYYNDRRKFK